MFAGSQPLKKRAFKPPSFVDKDVIGTEAVPRLPDIQKAPAMKRRRLLVCPALVNPESQPTKSPQSAEKLEKGRPAGLNLIAGTSRADDKVKSLKTDKTTERCPRPLPEISSPIEKPSQPAAQESLDGLFAQLHVVSKQLDVTPQPLVSRDAVLRIQAQILPQKLQYTALAQPPDEATSSVSKPGLNLNGGEMSCQKHGTLHLQPPAKIGMHYAPKRPLRQARLEELPGVIKAGKRPCSTARLQQETIPEQAPEQSAKLQQGHLEDVSLALTAQPASLQHLQFGEIWKSPEKQLQEMMKAPALPLARNLSLEFLRSII